MSLTPKPSLLLFVFFSLLLTITTSYTTSIIELLKSQGLPGGLFPRNIKSYDYDELTGRLEVHLESPCLTMYEIENRVYFEKVVRANLTYGGLIGLEGLSQEELFLWFPVKGIIVNDPGLILIDIGFAHKQLSLSLFEDPPVCNLQGKDTLIQRIGKKMGIDQAFEIIERPRCNLCLGSMMNNFVALHTST
ncbi:hypothetical protein QYF36_005287 [Acer negundo]|nr:hypothetical protein QYF36_005287 [Acer negundo]